MPCSSEYLEPNKRERELQRAAKLLLYVYSQIPIFAYSITDYDDIEKTANDIYASKDYVAVLCGTLRILDSKAQERIIYNAHDPVARDLADWWEAHQKADNDRVEQEQDALRKTQLTKSARSKLSDEEWEAVTRDQL